MATPTTVSEALQQASQHIDQPEKTLDASDLPLHFSFTYGHAEFQAKVSQVGNRVILALTGDVGQLAYTIENPSARSMMYELVNQSKKFHNIDFQLVGDNTIRMRQLAVISPPFTKEHLLAKTVDMLFKDRHYFKLINLLRR